MSYPRRSVSVADDSSTITVTLNQASSSHNVGLTSHRLETVLLGGLTPKVPAGRGADCGKEPGIFIGGGYGAETVLFWEEGATLGGAFVAL